MLVKWCHIQIKIGSILPILHVNSDPPSVRRISIFWTNEYPNIFVTIDIGQMNIQIYSPWNNGRE